MNRALWIAATVGMAVVAVWVGWKVAALEAAAWRAANTLAGRGLFLAGIFLVCFILGRASRRR